MSYVNFLAKAPKVDEQTVRGYPREYATLAYLLDKSGFSIVREFPTRDSPRKQRSRLPARRGSTTLDAPGVLSGWFAYRHRR